LNPAFHHLEFSCFLKSRGANLTWIRKLIQE
jgi:hypothetical protein